MRSKPPKNATDQLDESVLPEESNHFTSGCTLGPADGALREQPCAFANGWSAIR